MLTSLFRTCLLLLFLLPLSACKEVLYSSLAENEANEMVAILAASGIDAGREVDKDQNYAVTVHKDSVPSAVVVLKNNGFPRSKYLSIGDLFTADGIVASPFEQQARFIHAMNQELASSIASISGIREARVLVSAPQKGRYGEVIADGRASVTVHYEPNFRIEENIAKIRQIVSYSMANIPFDNVAVSVFEAGGPEVASVGFRGNEGVTQASFVPSALVDSNYSPIGSSFFLIIIALSCFCLAGALLNNKIFKRKPE